MQGIGEGTSGGGLWLVFWGVAMVFGVFGYDNHGVLDNGVWL